MDLYKQKLDFVHVVSHEVRNPLTVINAYAKMVLNNTKDRRDRERLAAISDYVTLIDNEISHVIETEEMLSTDALWRKKLVSPYALLQEVTSIMEIKARTQNITFERAIALSGSETILSNSTGFKLIVSNLLSNAIKYSDEGGLVQCTANEHRGVLTIVIADHGVGMSEEQLSKLFRKYEKLNEEKGGQGIGLFMVKKLVDYFEGSIEVMSELGKGTTIVVALPLHQAMGLEVAVEGA
nr:HAMP domain-containing sensor histidine kinase [Paenibacillus turpanensis]